MLTTTREETELRRELVPNGLVWVIKDDLKSRRRILCKHPHHLGRCKICTCPN